MQIFFQSNVSVGVQFYPWFKFYFVLFQTHYHIIIIYFHTQKQKKTKFQPRIKLKHNISIIRRWKLVKHLFVSLETIDEKWMSIWKTQHHPLQPSALKLRVKCLHLIRACLREAPGKPGSFSRFHFYPGITASRYQPEFIYSG